MQYLSEKCEFIQSILYFDEEILNQVRLRGCPHCGSSLHTANYPRKPRGLAEHINIRYSLCCSNQLCRKRLTPPSLLFYPRKIYPSLVLILALDFCKHLGLSKKICRQTLGRWKNFWHAKLAESNPFMKWANGFLKPDVFKSTTPSFILHVFDFPKKNAIFDILKFFSMQI